MYRIGTIVLMGAFLLSLAAPLRAGEKETDPAIAKEAEQAYREYLESGVRKDEKKLLAILSDDFTLTLVTGKVWRRADTIGALLSPELKQEATTVADLKVRTFGTAAVINARCTEKGEKNGIAFANPMQCTVTLAKVGGKWVVVAEHISNVRE
jgi:ketosteroid isomerase-like protein